MTQTVQNPGISPAPLPNGVSSHHRTTEGGNGWELGRRLRRRRDTREGAGRPRPGRWWRREETEGTWSRRSQVGPRPQPKWWPHGGADGGRSHRGVRADRWQQSRWWKSPRRRRRANEPGECKGSGGPGWGPMWSLRERWAQRSQWDRATRCSRRSEVLMRWRVNARPKQSRRNEGAWWIDGWPWRWGS